MNLAYFVLSVAAQLTSGAFFLLVAGACRRVYELEVRLCCAEQQAGRTEAINIPPPGVLGACRVGAFVMAAFTLLTTGIHAFLWWASIQG